MPIELTEKEKELELVTSEYEAELDASHPMYKLHRVQKHIRFRASKPYYTNIGFLIKMEVKLNVPILFTYIDSVRGHFKTDEISKFFTWKLDKEKGFHDYLTARFMTNGKYKIEIEEVNDNQCILTCISKGK